MKFQLVLLVAVMCIVLGLSSPVDSFKKKVIKVVKYEKVPVYVKAPVYAHKKIFFPKKFWKINKAKSVMLSPVVYSAPAPTLPIKSKWIAPVQSQQWEPRPQVMLSVTKDTSKVHWISKRAPEVKSVPCRTTERPTLRPNLVAVNQARPAPTWTVAKTTQGPPVVVSEASKQAWSPEAPVAEQSPATSTIQTSKQAVLEPALAHQAALAPAKESLSVPSGAGKMSFAAEPERMSYFEVMEPEP